MPLGQNPDRGRMFRRPVRWREDQRAPISRDRGRPRSSTRRTDGRRGLRAGPGRWAAGGVVSPRLSWTT